MNQAVYAHHQHGVGPVGGEVEIPMTKNFPKVRPKTAVKGKRTGFCPTPKPDDTLHARPEGGVLD